MSTTAQADRDWPGDLTHENGNYMCTCLACGHTFTGYKRRSQCRVCAAADEGLMGAGDALALFELPDTPQEAFAAGWNQRLPTGTVAVPALALRRVLEALHGSPHLVRELQATMAPAELFADNPINQLTAAYHAAGGR